MHILAFVLYFIIGSIDAATKGDWSGFEAMGKFLLYAGLFILMAFLTQIRQIKNLHFSMAPYRI